MHVSCHLALGHHSHVPSYCYSEYIHQPHVRNSTYCHMFSRTRITRSSRDPHYPCARQQISIVHTSLVHEAHQISFSDVCIASLSRSILDAQFTIKCTEKKKKTDLPADLGYRLHNSSGVNLTAVPEVYTDRMRSVYKCVIMVLFYFLS